MKKLRIKDVIKFRKKRTESTKKTFIQNLKNERNQQNNSEARNYWVRSESAIKSTFKHNEPRYITDKLNELNELLLDPTHHSNTIKQYKHNVIILKQFEHFDFNLIKPSDNIKILSQRTEDKILTIKGLPVECVPSFVYSFDDDDEIGAIWFIAQKDGFKKEELGMFADILGRYLKLYFAEKYVINSQYCIVVDLYNRKFIRCSQLDEGAIPKVLDRTLEEINKITQ